MKVSKVFRCECNDGPVPGGQAASVTVMPPAPLIGALALIGVSELSSSPITDSSLRDHTLSAASRGIFVFFWACSGCNWENRETRPSISCFEMAIVRIVGSPFRLVHRNVTRCDG